MLCKEQKKQKLFGTCDEILPQQYDINPTICSSNFIITTSTSSYTIDEPVHGEFKEIN